MISRLNLTLRERGDNPPMPQTNKEKQQDYRARMAMLGMKEVRGLFLPAELHPVIKSHGLKLLASDTAKKIEAAKKPV